MPSCLRRPGGLQGCHPFQELSHIPSNLGCVQTLFVLASICSDRLNWFFSTALKWGFRAFYSPDSVIKMLFYPRKESSWDWEHSFCDQENEAPLREAWAKEQELQERREEEKREKRVSLKMSLTFYDNHWYLVSQVLDNWKRLIRGLTIKQKIKLKYMKDWILEEQYYQNISHNPYSVQIVCISRTRRWSKYRFEKWMFRFFWSAVVPQHEKKLPLTIDLKNIHAFMRWYIDNTVQYVRKTKSHAHPFWRRRLGFPFSCIFFRSHTYSILLLWS